MILTGFLCVQYTMNHAVSPVFSMDFRFFSRPYLCSLVCDLDSAIIEKTDCGYDVFVFNFDKLVLGIDAANLFAIRISDIFEKNIVHISPPFISEGEKN